MPCRDERKHAHVSRLASLLSGTLGAPHRGGGNTMRRRPARRHQRAPRRRPSRRGTASRARRAPRFGGSVSTLCSSSRRRWCLSSPRCALFLAHTSPFFSACCPKSRLLDARAAFDERKCGCRNRPRNACRAARHSCRFALLRNRGQHLFSLLRAHGRPSCRRATPSTAARSTGLPPSMASRRPPSPLTRVATSR